MGRNNPKKKGKDKFIPFDQYDKGKSCRNCRDEAARASLCDNDDQRNEVRKGESRVAYEGSDHHNKGSEEPGSVKKSTSQSSSSSEKRASNSLNGKMMEIRCMECQEKFTSDTHLPKSLLCGHTLCCYCLSECLERARCCPKCKTPFGDNENMDSFHLNYSVLKIIEENRTVTVGSHEPMENCQGRATNRGYPNPERSPHDSRCLEGGIKPLYYCALCLKWVCEKCGDIDHSQPKCHLIPKKEALDQMTKAQLNEAKVVQENLESNLSDLKKYEESLDSFSFAMQAAFESIAIEKKRVKEMEEGRLKKIKELDVVVEALSDVKNLPGALTALRNIEDQCRTTLDWQKDKICETLDEGKVVKITKEILLSAVLMKSNAEKEAKSFGYVLAQHCIKGVTYYSRLEAVGGRVLVHALKRVATVPVGSRAISLNSILHCFDKASSLTFLDIGWNGKMMERVFVRLIGDTLRGRQFSALCTGMFGPSFHKTGFHRIWWKGLPGEHVWGGDYEKNDGSSGTSLLDLMKEEKDAIPHGLELPITPGLVAGRYEKSNASSIFRIYTRGHESEGEHGAYGGFPCTTVGGKDEASFGYVEHGLNILQNAIRLGKVDDITIFNCGIVIETN